MSLRDQLLKSGLVNKKAARRLDREQKQARKSKQGSKQRKNKIRREREAAEAAKREADSAARLAQRREREQVRDRYEAALRVRNLILGNRVKNRGSHPFYIRDRDGLIHRMDLHPKVATELSNGRLGVARLDHGTRVEFVLIGSNAAERLAELDPSVLVHWTPGPHPPDPSERLLQRDWEPSLVPHRVATES